MTESHSHVHILADRAALAETVLGMSATARLVRVVPALVLLWLGVAWALGWIG